MKRTFQFGTARATEMFSVPANKPTRGKDALFALGRLPAGQMNKVESRFAEWLEFRRLKREVAWWKFQGLRFILAPNTTLTPDFNVLMPDGQLHIIDTKGSRAVIQDDALAKMKIAAATFPLRFFFAFPGSRTTTSDWTIEEI